MICCDELPSGVLSLYHYFNIVTIISSYAGEDESLIEMDWEEYIAKQQISKSYVIYYVKLTLNII